MMITAPSATQRERIPVPRSSSALPRPPMRFASALADHRDHAGGKRMSYDTAVASNPVPRPLRRRLKLFEQRIRKALLEGRQILGHGHVNAPTRGGSTNETGASGGRVEPRPNAWQARTTARHSLASASTVTAATRKTRAMRTRGFRYRKAPGRLEKRGPPNTTGTAATGQLDDAIVLPLVAVTAHQAQLHGLRIEGKQSHSAYEAFHAPARHILPTYSTRNGWAARKPARERTPGSCSSFPRRGCGRQAGRTARRSRPSRLVQRHHAVERADSCRNAVFLQIVVTQLAEVGGMANAPNRARTALRASRNLPAIGDRNRPDRPARRTRPSRPGYR